MSILAANGFPQVLVRFLPEHAARGGRAAALRVCALAILTTGLACVVLLLAVAAAKRSVLSRRRGRPPTPRSSPWFSVTTLAVALKLVLYGGFNGLRRFGSQTVLETCALAVAGGVDVARARLARSRRLFEIIGVTSAVSALIARAVVRRAPARATSSTATRAGHGSYGRYWVGAVGL